MALDKYPKTKHFFDLVWGCLEGDPSWEEHVTVEGEGILSSSFCGSDFASGVYAALGVAVSELVATTGVPAPKVKLDRQRSSSFSMCNSQPLAGWKVKGADMLWQWFPTADDRWLELCSVYQHQRARALIALQSDGSVESLSAAIKSAGADELETLIQSAGGFAVASHTMDEWAEHPHGKMVMAEPLLDVKETNSREDNGWRPTPERPLAGIRVLDCTRVAAGPAATRFLAAMGAEVLRIDPPVFEETAGTWAVGDNLQGKRCARLDLKSWEGHDRFLDLLRGADIFAHGLRNGALDSIGLEPAVREETRPGLIEVCLDAYGWTGPWQGRRGYDSPVLTSTGITLAEGEWAGLGRPRGLGTAVADFSTGYSLAAAAIRGLTRRLQTGMGSRTRAALARSAAAIAKAGRNFEPEEPYLPGEGARGAHRSHPVGPEVYSTINGPARRLLPPFEIENAPIRWDREAELLGSSEARWGTVPGDILGFEWWSKA